MSQIELFDYSKLAPDLQVEVKAATERIKLRMKRTAEDIIEIGKDLIAVKEKLPHGQFLSYIDTEFEMSQQTASRFMQSAERFGDKLLNLGNFKPSIIYELASSSTPDEVVERVIEKAENGETVTAKEVKELKAQLKEKESALARLERAKQSLTSELQEQKELAQELEDSLDKSASEKAQEIVKREVAKATEELRLKVSELMADKKTLENQLAIKKDDLKTAKENYEKALRDFKANPDPETTKAINEAQKALEELNGQHNLLISQVKQAENRIKETQTANEARAGVILTITGFFNAIDKAFASHPRIGSAIVSPHIDEAHIERFKEIMNAFYEYGNLINEALNSRGNLAAEAVEVEVVDYFPEIED